MKNASNFCFLVQSSMFSFAILIFNLAGHGLLNLQISDWFTAHRLSAKYLAFFPTPKLAAMSSARRSTVFCATQKFRPKIWQKYTATIEDVNLTKQLFHARLLDRSPLLGARNCLIFVSQRFHRPVYFLIEFLAHQSQFCKLSIIHVLCLALRIGHFRRRNNDGRPPFLVGCGLVRG